MSDFKGLPTHDNLKMAYANESGTLQRYLYFAKIADIEGYPDVAQLFRELAEGGLHAVHGNMDFLKQVGDPTTDLPIGETERNLVVAISAEMYDHNERYPQMSAEAREDAFTDIASWFETLGKLKRSHVKRLREAHERLLGQDEEKPDDER